MKDKKNEKKEELDFNENLYFEKFKSALKVADKIQRDLGVRLDMDFICKIALTLFINHSKNKGGGLK